MGVYWVKLISRSWLCLLCGVPLLKSSVAPTGAIVVFPQPQCGIGAMPYPGNGVVSGCSWTDIISLASKDGQSLERWTVHSHLLAFIKWMEDVLYPCYHLVVTQYVLVLPSVYFIFLHSLSFLLSSFLLFHFKEFHLQCLSWKFPNGFSRHWLAAHFKCFYF